MRRTAGLVWFAALVIGCAPEGGDDDGANADAGSRTATAIVISPQDPEVVVRNGVADAVAFEATIAFDDGTQETASAGAWSLIGPPLGELAALTGKFVASGELGGTAQVRVVVGELQATTNVTVRVQDQHVGDGVPGDAPDRFDGTPITGSPQSPPLYYPLGGAVVPATLAPPHVQWDGGAQGDLYRVTVDAEFAKAEAYLAHGGAGFTYDWLVDATSWGAIKRSAGTAPVTFTVERWAAADGTVYGSATHAITIADANVAGAIYYWDLSGGRILRITSAGREDFMPSPPPRPGDNGRCVACHTVSRDGSRMAAGLWGGGDFGAIFDLTANLDADPAPTLVPPNQFRVLSSTFNPDATRLLVNDGTALALVDGATGVQLPPMGAGLPAAGAAHPTWSPDGSLIAYIANHDGTWGVDFTLGDLATIPAAGADAFGNPIVLRAADGMANTWPSFSPDSQWIAFGRGTNSRGRNGDTLYPGSLWMVHRDGGAALELANANGGAGVMNSYLPNFSPFDEGGYFWLAFYSTRDYGNAHVGTRGTGRRQLWVAAIKNAPTAGADPSFVPYWLPAQDIATHNMSAYWAVEPPVN